MIHVIECSAWIPSGLCIYKQVVRFLAVHSIAPLFSMSANSKESFEENWLPEREDSGFLPFTLRPVTPPVREDTIRGYLCYRTDVILSLNHAVVSVENIV